jgi:hypothetical protein
MTGMRLVRRSRNPGMAARPSTAERVSVSASGSMEPDIQDATTPP